MYLYLTILTTVAPHLPDVTVLTPVFVEASEIPLFFVASRGHHADIGGIAPGSMPSNSVTIADEGVLINNFALVRRGEFQETSLRELLNSGPHPARNPRPKYRRSKSASRR